MRTYDLKRAVVTILSSRTAEPDIENATLLRARLKKIKKFKRDGHDFRHTRALIQENRKNQRGMPRTTYKVQIYVKQYKETITTELIYWPIDESFRECIKNAVNQSITRCRREQKYEPKKFPIRKNVFLLTHAAKGRTFAAPGQILDLYVKKNVKALYTDKVPNKPNRYIGVELEFCAPISESELAIRLFRSGVHKFAQLKQDGSLRPQGKEQGFELAVLLEESNFKKPLKQILDILHSVKATAEDRRAGLHVHLDMRRRNRDLVYNNLVACQRALMSVVHPSRQDNEFCQWVRSRKFPTDLTGSRDERYKTINAVAFYKYKTLEVRMHEGSLDYTQIVNWIKLLIKVTNYPKKMRDEIERLTVLSKRINLDKRVYNFLQDRSMYHLFNRRPSPAQPTAQPEPDWSRMAGELRMIRTNMNAAIPSPVIVPLMQSGAILTPRTGMAAIFDEAPSYEPANVILDGVPGETN